ncbi:Actin, muscle [Gryllus bimaculatus]|nr:Actin, muscle [Gryllus bimaculatus]
MAPARGRRGARRGGTGARAAPAPCMRRRARYSRAAPRPAPSPVAAPPRPPARAPARAPPPPRYTSVPVCETLVVFLTLRFRTLRTTRPQHVRHDVSALVVDNAAPHVKRPSFAVATTLPRRSLPVHRGPPPSPGRHWWACGAEGQLTSATRPSPSEDIPHLEITPIEHRHSSPNWDDMREESWHPHLLQRAARRPQRSTPILLTEAPLNPRPTARR